MMYFKHLRSTPWKPTFKWVDTIDECAHEINSYHEDYPKYVEATRMVIQNTTPVGKIFNRHLLLIHRYIFADWSFKGKWREVNVKVGTHLPPSCLDIPSLMAKLESLYEATNLQDLTGWYHDFETIHPFQDGNGRVGGVIVAAYAHKLHPYKGWLAPNQ